MIRPLALLLACTANTLAAQGKPTLKPADYGKWESVAGSRLSPDGEWLAVNVNRVNEEHELLVRGGPRDTTYVAAYAATPTFTGDSRWAGYLVRVSPKERERLEKEKKPVRTSFAARDLRSGAVIALADVSAFAFSPDGRYVSLTRYPADGKRTNDVVVHDLQTGARLLFSGVAEQAWAPIGAMLAFSVNGEGGAGSSIQLFDGAIGATRVLETSPGLYRAISWRARSADLAVLRSVTEKAFVDTTHAILAWRNVAQSGASLQSFDPTLSPSGLAATLRIADTRRPQWARDGSALFVGVRERHDTASVPKKSSEKISDVEIWHPNDVRVIPQQRSSEQFDLRATRLAVWSFGTTTVRPLTEDRDESAAVLEGDSYVTETDRTPYPFGQKFGRRDQDVYVIRVSDGRRTKALAKVRHYFGADPSGRLLTWFDGKDHWTLDHTTGKRTNVTGALTSARRADFVDRDDDHPTDVLPSVGSLIWTKDSTRALVYDQTDLWSVALDGSGGSKLTDGGRAGIQHRLVSFVPFSATAAERAVDLSKPLLVSLYGRRTKQSGYAKLVAGRLTRLMLVDAGIGALSKADSVERYAFTRQRFDESPNVYVAGVDLANAVAKTRTNTFQAEYAWGKAELMDFTSTIGRPLQAILYYPADYTPGKKYPMIVYTYELLTQGFHRYLVPREDDYYNANVFTQQGYFVLMPDIVFRPREPGIATLHAVEPAVRAVIAKGLVDPARVGHAGHSQGGYEAAYLATHSKLFATAVMGAGISDMISFAGQMHWSSVPEFDHWETGQFRMQVPPWEDMDAMLKNSPINKIHEMPAKSLLIEIGGDDPTVDMRQGVELYNYARRAGKHAVMLLYPGEGHGLGKKENAIDYERRILQWFGHYLKGEPAAQWITDGQTWIDRKRILDANK